VNAILHVTKVSPKNKSTITAEMLRSSVNQALRHPEVGMDWECGGLS